MQILALDLSQHVGVAWGSADREPPQFATWHLPPSSDHFGATVAALENELAALLASNPVGRMVIEETLPLPAMNNRSAALQQIGLRAAAYAEGYRAGLRAEQIVEHAATTVRNALCSSRTRAMLMGDPKQRPLMWCRLVGWPIADDHQADAALLWEYERRRRYPQYRPQKELAIP